MQTDSLHTVLVRDTTHAILGKAITNCGQAPDVRHAAIVVNRMIRSGAGRDQEVRQRLERVAIMLRAVDPPTESAVSNQPRNLVFKLADRLIRCLRS